MANSNNSFESDDNINDDIMFTTPGHALGDNVVCLTKKQLSFCPMIAQELQTMHSKSYKDLPEECKSQVGDIQRSIEDSQLPQSWDIPKVICEIIAQFAIVPKIFIFYFDSDVDQTMQYIVAYLQYCASNKNHEIAIENIRNEFETIFIDSVPLESLYKLVNAANYLNIENLRCLASYKIMEMGGYHNNGTAYTAVPLISNRLEFDDNNSIAENNDESSNATNQNQTQMGPKQDQSRVNYRNNVANGQNANVDASNNETCVRSVANVDGNANTIDRIWSDLNSNSNFIFRMTPLEVNEWRNAHTTFNNQ